MKILQHTIKKIEVLLVYLPRRKHQNLQPVRAKSSKSSVAYSTDHQKSSKIFKGVNELDKRRFEPEPEQPLTADDLLDWIMNTRGAWFKAELIDRQFGIRATAGKKNRWQMLKRLVEKGVCEQNPALSDTFRFVDKSRNKLDWASADPNSALPLKYPLNLERFVMTYPKNIIVIAGAMDAGKTTWLLNLANMNMREMKVDYFNSEMGEQELKIRLMKSGIPLDDWEKNLNVYERSNNFADIIDPDAVTIIDYIKILDQFWLVGQEIEAIFNKLKKGVAIVALQKEPNRKIGSKLYTRMTGRGGSITLETPRLYLAIDRGLLTIVKAKNWVSDDTNPNLMNQRFTIRSGFKIAAAGLPWWGDIEGEGES